MSTQIEVCYDNRIVRWFIWAAIAFGVIGMLVGLLAALQLAWWPANGGLSWLTYGRIRALHTNAVIFAFAGNAFFACLYYSLPRLLKAPMYFPKLSWFHFYGWQIIILSAAILLPLGYTQGKEYAELPWPVDVAIAVVWVALTVNVMATIAKRNVDHLYVAIWFYVGSLFAIAMLHVVNSLALPVSFLHSYPIYSGVQDALVQWWYGHNAVGFFLTTPFLGMMYYFLPKACGQPVYSYRLSIVHFWSLVFIYIWAGPHHLLYTALPEWAQSLGMAFSLMLIAPSWGGMLNGLLTMRGSWDRLRSDPILKFFVMALTFYGMATLEGPLLSIKSLNLISHYTDWTIAHVHAGALGWVGGMVFACLYYLVPKLYDRELYSVRLANWHFWIATIGILLYTTSMWSAGVTQGLMWFATNADGRLLYPNFIETVLAIKPLFWVRFVGGVLYFGGIILFFYNIFRTARGAAANDDVVKITLAPPVKPTTVHELLESKSFWFSLLVGISLLVGGVVEILPTFLLQLRAPIVAAIRPYSPLELAGRDIYVREGCYNCHSQMVRTYDKEVLRYGRKSEAEEFIYDFPFQWGSVRKGPDLHRAGGKYPHMWHYKHMLDPRATSPGSIMPPYPWLATDEIDRAELTRKLKVMKTLGVPYSDDEITNAPEAARVQGEKIVTDLARDGVVLSPDSEMTAMIAYLQRLGTDLGKATKQ